ncbi:MAG: tyrosine-type recombinase/integrase [Synergistaceae bacterium]|jgi:integrase|nr:tyrosine-type recombinase/integrase [Synergistaceae bacterium]
MSLTELAVRNAKPREKPYSLSDGDGLLLLVKESGAKSWVLRYWVNGKEKRAGLGKYPIIRLTDARELKNNFKRELAHGGNPQERKKTEREEAAKAEALKTATFEKFANEWYSRKEEDWSLSTRRSAKRMLNHYLLPALGKCPIREITTQELLNLLLEIEKETPENAHQSKGIAGQIFQFAVTRGDADFNIVYNLKNALRPKNKKHRAALTAPKDVAELMKRIEAFKGSEVIRAALWFSLYTFQRPGEIRGAAWEEMDFNAKLWRIPEQRMKNRRPHVVPLSRQVLELLENIRGLVLQAGNSPFVFPSTRARTIPISEGTVVLALRAMGYTGEEMCAHGFRALASTNLNEQGWNRDVIELSLSHVENNAVRAAYNHADRLSERQEMMQAWADWLDELHKREAF